jgi:hypothetical protein
VRTDLARGQGMSGVIPEPTEQDSSGISAVIGV